MRISIALLHSKRCSTELSLRVGRNGNTVLPRFEHGDAIEICNGIMFDYYLGLPHMLGLDYPVHAVESK